MKPTQAEIKSKLDRVSRAFSDPKNKWEERDHDYLWAVQDTLVWLLGGHEPKSPEAGI